MNVKLQCGELASLSSPPLYSDSSENTDNNSDDWQYHITSYGNEVECLLSLCLFSSLPLSPLTVEPEGAQDPCPGSNGQLWQRGDRKVELTDRRTVSHSRSSCQQW